MIFVSSSLSYNLEHNTSSFLIRSSQGVWVYPLFSFLIVITFMHWLKIVVLEIEEGDVLGERVRKKRRGEDVKHMCKITSGRGRRYGVVINSKDIFVK